MNKQEFIEKAICKKSWRKYVDKKDEPMQGLDFEHYKEQLIKFIVDNQKLSDIYFVNYNTDLQFEINRFTERYLVAEFA